VRPGNDCFSTRSRQPPVGSSTRGSLLPRTNRSTADRRGRRGSPLPERLALTDKPAAWKWRLAWSEPQSTQISRRHSWRRPSASSSPYPKPHPGAVRSSSSSGRNLELLSDGPRGQFIWRVGAWLTAGPEMRTDLSHRIQEFEGLSAEQRRDLVGNLISAVRDGASSADGRAPSTPILTSLSSPRRIYGKLPPRHGGTTRNDGVGGSSPPSASQESPANNPRFG
jgi:hypothetical protein